MFQKLRITMNLKKIFKSWGGDPNHPAISEMIVASPFMVIMAQKKNSAIFSNKYVCADAALISCAFAANVLADLDGSEKIISDIKNKTMSTIRCLYSISDAELQKMQSNRLAFFSELLKESEPSLTPILEEAALVFTHDLHHEKYVEYTKNSPLVIVGIEEQFSINSQTVSFLNANLDVIINYIKQFLC